MKNLKSEFFMNIIHMQKWRVTSVYVAIPRLDQDMKPCSVPTVYDGSIVYVVISNQVMTVHTFVYNLALQTRLKLADSIGYTIHSEGILFCLIVMKFLMNAFPNKHYVELWYYYKMQSLICLWHPSVFVDESINLHENISEDYVSGNKTIKL
jgi:hypothetical protein